MNNFGEIGHPRLIPQETLILGEILIEVKYNCIFGHKTFWSPYKSFYQTQKVGAIPVKSHEIINKQY